MKSTSWVKFLHIRSHTQPELLESCLHSKKVRNNEPPGGKQQALASKYRLFWWITSYEFNPPSEVTCQVGNLLDSSCSEIHHFSKFSFSVLKRMKFFLTSPLKWQFNLFLFEILYKTKIPKSVSKAKHNDCCNINLQISKQNKDLNAHKYWDMILNSNEH